MKFESKSRNLDINAPEGPVEQVGRLTLHAKHKSERPQSSHPQGELFRGFFSDEGEAKAALRAKRITSCSNNERFAIQIGSEQPWQLYYIFPNSLGLGEKISADNCEAALQQGSSPEAWIRKDLTQLNADAQKGALKPSSLIAEEWPEKRRLWAFQNMGAFIIAMHEGIAVDEAFAFSFTHDPSRPSGMFSDPRLSRTDTAGDSYGAFDPFMKERKILWDRLRQGSDASPDLEAQFFRILLPKPSTGAPYEHSEALTPWVLKLIQASPNEERHIQYVEQSLELLKDPSNLPYAYPWRMTALGHFIRSLHDPRFCAAAQELQQRVQESAAEFPKGAGEEFAAQLKGCIIVP